MPNGKFPVDFLRSLKVSPNRLLAATYHVLGSLLFFPLQGQSFHPDIDYNNNASLYVYAGTIIRYEEQQTKNIVPIELHTIRLGNIAISNNPFELYLDYGNRIRARSLAKQTFLLQMSNGNLGYLPTEKAEKAGHYSAYISSGNVGHEGGDLLVRKTLESINNMF